MNTSTTVMRASASVYSTGPFWDRLWRMSGINVVVFFIAAYVLYSYQPQIAAFVAGMAILNLMWFVAALRTTLANERQDGWGAAVAASSATLGALLFLLITTAAVLACPVTGAATSAVAPGLSDFAWGAFVMTSFPRAMLIMAGTFGLWRAGLISNSVFAAGVAAIVLVLLGGTTWMSGGFWAPDGIYSRLISPIIGLAWVLAVSAILLVRNPGQRAGW